MSETFQTLKICSRWQSICIMGFNPDERSNLGDPSTGSWNWEPRRVVPNPQADLYQVLWLSSGPLDSCASPFMWHEDLDSTIPPPGLFGLCLVLLLSSDKWAVPFGWLLQSFNERNVGFNGPWPRCEWHGQRCGAEDGLSNSLNEFMAKVTFVLCSLLSGHHFKDHCLAFLLLASVSIDFRDRSSLDQDIELQCDSTFF